MAWTVTKVVEGGASGNYRHVVYSIAADSATAVVPTGLKNLVGFSLGLASVATTSRIRGVIASSTISFICAAGGDTFYLTVYGS